MFRTESSENHLVATNSCLMVEYKEEDSGLPTTAYGKIQRLFQHAMYPGGPASVIAECAWYSEVEKTPSFTRIRYNPHWNRCRLVFLKNIAPVNVVFWPAVLDPANTDVYVVRRRGYVS